MTIEYDLIIATCLKLPEPDQDEELLLAALGDVGLRVRLGAWDDPDVDWEESPATLIRSTWNYHRRRDDFIRWAEDVARARALWNPVDVLRWNSHKRYLLQLPMRGVPVVPTVLIEAGTTLELSALCRAEGWSKLVLKPAVSAGSYETHVMDADAIDQDVFARLVTVEDMLVQPYIESVDGYGERSLIFIDGHFTHCVRKHPRFADQDEAITGPFSPSDEELTTARRALEAVSAPLLYARVDLVRGEDGKPLVAELELIEPSLFFCFSEESLSRFITAIKTRLKGLPRC